MRRPLVLATTLAAELAAGTLALAPPVAAQTLPDAPVDAHAVASDPVDPGPGDPGPVAETPSDDPAEPGPAPVRTGRAEPSPDGDPADQPAPAVPTTIRTGRLDEAFAVPDRPTRTGTSGAAPRGAPDDPTSASAPRTAGSPKTGSPNTGSPNTGSPKTSPPTPDAATSPDAGPTGVPTADAPRHVVVAGDHLWAIAAQQVAAASGRAPSELAAADVVTYWVQLCMQNRPHLRSGNPSLIYPGEVIDLPVTG